MTFELRQEIGRLLAFELGKLTGNCATRLAGHRGQIEFLQCAEQESFQIIVGDAGEALGIFGKKAEQFGLVV